MKPVVKIAIVVGGLALIGLVDFYYPDIDAWMKKRDDDRKRKIAEDFLDGKYDFEDINKMGVSYSLVNSVKRERDDNKAKEAWSKQMQEALKRAFPDKY